MTAAKQPIPMYLTCPKCGARHLDEGEFATKPHHTHSCQSCGLTWRPAVEPTVGVAFLPGFKNSPPEMPPVLNDSVTREGFARLVAYLESDLGCVLPAIHAAHILRELGLSDPNRRDR